MSRTAGLVARMLGLAIVAALQVAWLLQPVPLALKILQLALIGLALARPSAAVLAVAGLAPLVAIIARLTASPFPSPRILEQMILATATGALVRAGESRTRIGAPAALFAAVAAASAASVLPAQLVARTPDATFSATLAALWRTEYFQMGAAWQPLQFAALAIESALLGWIVERSVRSRDGAAVDQVLRTAIFGVAGCALLSLHQITAAALRSPAFVETFLNLFATVRTSIMPDLNAAGSMFATCTIASISLLITARWPQRVLYGGLLAAIAIGLWLSGSRVAVASLLAVLAVTAAVTAWRRTAAARVMTAALVTVAVAAAAALFAWSPAARHMPVSRSIQSRLTLLKAGGAMFRSAPVWGIGVGGFDERSAEIAGEEIAALLGVNYDGRINYGENAHNNYVQILAEEGLVGLGALLLLLGTVAIGVVGAEADAPDGRRRWLAYGLLAGTLTWLAGHPLLVPEFSTLFWIYLGGLAALTPPPRRVWPLWLSVAAVAVVLASAPVRAVQELHAANLEYRAVGLSPWQHDDLMRYRLGGASFSLYVPGRGTAVIPIRRAPGAPDPLRLELRLDGRLINAIHIGGDEWTSLRLTRRGDDRRFILIEVTVMASPPEDLPTETALVRVGKPYAQ